jgi:outer membrane protein assembly factor BamA
VRGYDSNDFDARDCEQTATSSCALFDRLIGSRVAVANAEIRFPLWSAFGGDSFYGPLPVEVALFGDAGVAWGTGTVLGITDSGVFGQVENKDPVASYGVAVRANLFGFAVAEIDYVRPVHRPGRGWVWQFNLRPGF